MITILRLILTLLLVLGVLPMGMGYALVPGENRLYRMIGGFGAGFFIFQILNLIFHVTLGSFRLMVGIWFVLCGIVAVIGYADCHRKQKKSCVSDPAQKVKLDGIEWLLLAVAVGFVLLQVGNTVYSTFLFCSDDNVYCGTAVNAVFTDTVNRYSPTSGRLEPAFTEETEYILSSFSIYGGMLGLLAGLNPTIIMRTLMPILTVPLGYAVSYLLICRFLGDNKKKNLLALIYVEIFTVMAADKVYAYVTEWWHVVFSWTGKAIFSLIVMPLIFWLLIQLEEDAENNQACRRGLLFICWGAGLVSATAFFVVPVELGAWGIFYLLRTKRWRDIPYFILCGLPCVVNILLIAIL